LSGKQAVSRPIAKDLGWTLGGCPVKNAVVSETHKSGGELFIVDNSDEAWKGLRYLQDWTEIASAFDIATGYFEIGALLALDGKWQKLDKIRILMGDEVSPRTRIAGFIRSPVETPRKLALEQATLRDIHLKIEKHIKNTYLKQVQAPVGIKPVLKCWMGLN